MRRLVLLTLIASLLLAGDTPAQQCPELPFYVLVPFNYPCYIHPRSCRTDYGLCRIDFRFKPGAPCACQAANGAWLQGVCIH